MNNNTQTSSYNSLDPSLVERLIALQEKELIVRSQELEITKQDNDNIHEYAVVSLRANSEDKESERKYKFDIGKYRYFFVAFVIFLLVVLFCIALFLNKDQIVMELIKAILYISSGAIGGYAFCKTKVNYRDDAD